MKSSFQIGILCTVFCLGSTFFSSAVQTVNIGSTFSCTFLDSGEKGFFDSSSTHTWTSDQIDSAIRALNTWNTLINSTPGRTLNVGLTWYDGADSSTLASGLFPLLLLPVKQATTGFHHGRGRMARWKHKDYLRL